MMIARRSLEDWVRGRIWERRGPILEDMRGPTWGRAKRFRRTRPGRGDRQRRPAVLRRPA